MEFQDQMKSDWGPYYCNNPDVDISVNRHSLLSKVKNMWLENIWSNTEPMRVNGCGSRSFAMDARRRLDSLKSGCDSPVPHCATDRTLYRYNPENDLGDSEDSEDEESTLDMVEVLKLEDNVQDEENWLYECPTKKSSVEKKESALKWCRHVLDNPSPEMEAARHVLINKLDHRSNIYRSPAVCHDAATVSVDTCMDSAPVSTAQDTSDSLDHSELSVSHDSTTTNYRLQDITDVHIMARLQEASLRQEYVSTPASFRRNTDASAVFSSSLNTTVENTDDFTTGNKTEASFSTSWQQCSSSLNSSPRHSSTSAAKQASQSPKLTRLHQQVTQFKLLRLAQNQAGRTRSPLQTSLRSLQAVRNSRSLEADDCQPADQTTSGVSSSRLTSGCWSTSLNSNSSSHFMTDSNIRTAAIRRLQRSQSLSPHRIPHPPKGYLSVNGRVFASPERQANVAWIRNGPSSHQ